MKRALIAAAALFIAMVASPALALTQDEAKQIVTRAGCTADVSMVSSWYDNFNAYYAPGYHHIVLINFDHLPETWQRFILYHETGHCIQAQNSEFQGLRATGPYEIEWGADAFAIRQLAREGIDGTDLNHEIWATLYRQYGFEGRANDSHGTSVGRIVRGWLNRIIYVVESP